MAGGRKVNEADLKMSNNCTKVKARFHSSSTRISLNSDDPENGKIGHGISDVSFPHLLRFATKVELIFILLGAVAAIGRGPAFLILVILYSKLLNTFINGVQDIEGGKSYGSCNVTETAGERSFKSNNVMDGAIDYSIGVGILGIVCVVLDFVFVTFLNIGAEKQVIRLRSAYLQALLKQDIGWYDMRGPNELASQLSEELFKIQDGIGEKLGLFLFYLSTFASSIVGAFYYGWKLSIAIFAILPVISCSTAFLSRMQIRLNEKESKAYSGSAGLAEEVISAIKTVKTFNTQKSELENFKSSLKPALKAGIRRGLLTGIGSGLVWAANFSFFSLIFWYGIHLVLESCSNNGENYDAGSLSIILFVALDASYKVGQMLPLLEVFSIARGAAAGIFHILNQIPTINSSSTDGKSLSELKGNIRFDQVYFYYPSRPDVPVLSGATFQISVGETVALVGESGCGKSTCIQLLQRFYDPAHGRIEIDGNDVRTLNPRWLRDQIGVVSQQPVLFSTTIAENIRFGYPAANQEDIEHAARQANAHDFIRMLPMGYETEVGERGAQLSGGQRQRIAIARALIRNPKILLLDEATAALDINSEVAVQEALLQACQGRATVIVSHCLSTIRKADRIIVLHHGEIAEEGHHDDLMLRKGLYFHQVNSSEIKKKKNYQPTSENSFNSMGNAGLSTLLESNGEIESKSIKVEKQTEEGALKVSIYSLLLLGRAKFTYLILGAFGSVMVGLSTPIYAVIYGEVVWLLGQSNFPSFASYQKDYFALLFLALAMFTGFGSFIEKFMFSFVGEKLSFKLREISFEAILNKEVEWFDRPENSVGALCSQLHGDATAVQGATGSRIGLLVQVASSISVSLILSLFYSWKLGLASSLLVPFVLISTIVATKIGMNNQSITDAEQNGSRLLSEAVTNIRTVTTLGIQEIIHSNYMNIIRKSCEKNVSKSLIRGLIFGCTNNAMYFASIVTYCYGAYLIQNENLPFKTVIVIAEALVFGMSSIGQALAFTPNFGRAKSAGNRLVNLIQSNKNPNSKDHFLADRSEGKVTFTGVHFSYPNRSNVPVLRGLSTLVLPGQTVAIVGPNGCGKSTCLQLLQRLYNPQSGRISLDDCKIANFSSSAFSHLLGVVPQEPVLFNRTIVENIAYGMKDVKMEEVISAATKANIHSFIQSLPLSYETKVGQRGAQLSGGQKQRVAIARALIRNPRVLILDEATSALDSESETMVQDALEEARQGRTCILVSHRLSAFRNVDNILVMHKGKIVEQGRHSSLIDQKGSYHELWEKFKGK